MRQIFMCVLSLSLSGALTGLLILLVRPFTRRYFSKRWNYYIWLLVIARLLIPVYFETGYSYVLIKGEMGGLEKENEAGRLEDAAAGVSSQAKDPSFSQADNKQTADKYADNKPETAYGRLKSPGGDDVSVSGIYRQGNFLAAGRRVGNLGFILGILWLSGAGISLFIKLKNYMGFTSAVKRDCEPLLDERIDDMEDELAQKLCMRKSPAVYVSGNVSVPITVGLAHPAIVLPKEEWDLKDLQMIIHHEMLHVKRKDLWYKWAYQLLLCVHWFNPVLYLIGIKLNIDCELSCDEAVLMELTREGQKAYGNVLIDTAQKNMNFRRNVPSTTLLERKEDLKMRLKGILQYKRPGGFKAVISFGLSAVILCLSACGSVQTGPDAMPVCVEYSSFWDKAASDYEAFWADMGTIAGDWGAGLDDFLNRTVLVNTLGKAWQAYEDDGLTAGKDISDQWHMYSYMGGQRIKCDGMFLNGTASVLIAYAKKDVDLQVDSAFEVRDGRFKIVHVNPDGEVTVVNETGEAGALTVPMKTGRNVIKFVGQSGKIKNLRVEYPYLREKDFQALYYSEEDEESVAVMEEIKAGTVDKDKVMELLYYLDDDVISEAFALLLSQGVPLDKDEIEEFIIYSDSDLSARYLGEAVQNGKAGFLGEEVIIDIAPYIGGDNLKELLMTAGIKLTDDTVYECAPYLGSEGLKEVLLSMDDISFDLLCDCAPYLGSSKMEEVLRKYLKGGGKLSYSQFDDISPYLSREAIERLDDISFSL